MTVTFALFRLMPGDPVAILAKPGRLDPSDHERLKEQFGLKEPIQVQYVLYIKNLLSGNLGESYFYNLSVAEILAESLENTIVLVLPALTAAVIAALILGSYIGWKSGSKLEKAAVIGTILVYATPIYWLSIILLMIFVYNAGWFPSGGMFTPGYPQDSLTKYFSVDFLRHLILPFIAAFLYSFPIPFFVMRNSIIGVRSEKFMGFLKAKGISEYSQMKHGLRNGLLPFITFIAITVNLMIEGIFLLEVVFSWPGIGREIVTAVMRRDYPVAQGAFFLIGVVLIVMNLVADILYAQVDPRISYD